MLGKHIFKTIYWKSAAKDNFTLFDNTLPTTFYLTFISKCPIPPYYFYNTKINKHLYDYIMKSKIKSMVAFPMKTGVARRNFWPLSLTNLEEELKLNKSENEKGGKLAEQMTVNSNNVIHDGPILSDEEPPVQFINHIDQIYTTGTICTINVQKKQNSHHLYLKGETRLEINPDDYLKHQGPIMYVSGRTVKAEHMADINKEYEELLTYHSKIKLISTVNLPSIDLNDRVIPLKVIQMMTGYLCTTEYFSRDELHLVFRTINPQEKIKILLKFYKEYFYALENNWKNLQGEPEFIKNREREAIKTVYQNMKRIVGNPGEQKYIDKIRQKLKERSYPQHIKKLIESELSNLQTEGNHDISRKKHYINLLSDYPFGISTKEQFDVIKAKLILEEDHYGMAKLKKRILDFIAVGKLKGSIKSKVLLLYGPPGVGKTSIVKSIAKCLNRPYGRISLGGEYDTSIVKGHRKTYIGAYPGKIFDTIYKAKAQNPVILLDEIDKIMNRASGASLQDSIMEILDPIQNTKFKDDFIDAQIDLSQVLFICTANSLETIFPPLLDRLERIEVAGYTTHQKEEIFKRYILKDSMNLNGLTEEMQKNIQFSHSAINGLIQGYCKEAGVRNLVRKTNKIFQKIIYEYIKKNQLPKNIEKSDLVKYLGLPKFHQARLFPGVPPKGVMIGLAYNSYGGSIMYIETTTANLIKDQKKEEINSSPESLSKEKKAEQNVSGSLLVTGNIHDVMKESCQLAYTYAKYITSTFFQNVFLQKNDVHLNFPEIQIGKDGPSAGVAITCTLVSLALNQPAIHQIGMTGEINLSGKVSAIGGVKEKTMGAKRQGITKLIFPEENKRDVEELEAEIKDGMTFYFANHYFDVLDLVFGLKIEKEKAE